MLREVQKSLEDQGFTIISTDFTRPWGGFFVIDETQIAVFLEKYFPDIPTEDIVVGRKLSPKILVVAPHAKLSWQYHHRRTELWRIVKGPVGVVKSSSDEEGSLEVHEVHDIIRLQAGERHRLVGLESIGVVAEIWQHTDAHHPSDEDDIVRLDDAYGRRSFLHPL